MDSLKMETFRNCPLYSVERLRASGYTDKGLVEIRSGLPQVRPKASEPKKLPEHAFPKNQICDNEMRLARSVGKGRSHDRLAMHQPTSQVVKVPRPALRQTQVERLPIECLPNAVLHLIVMNELPHPSCKFDLLPSIRKAKEGLKSGSHGHNFCLVCPVRFIKMGQPEPLGASPYTFHKLRWRYVRLLEERP
jgi:hypothetical protein